MKNKQTKQRRASGPPLHVMPESITTLAGGMADDFNNILTTVMGACSLIDRDDPANAELLQCVALIRTSAEHAAVLSDKLMQASQSEKHTSCAGEPQKLGTAKASARDKKTNN